MRAKLSFILLAALGLIVASHQARAADDRYVGYYYPAPNSTEVYCARLPALPDANKRRRVGFIVGIKEGMGKRPYDVPYSVFAKGGQSEKLIIVAKTDGYLKTVYRARALLADLTNSARTTPIFEQSGAPEDLTFLDLLALLDFSSVTLSDGDRFTHQIEINPVTDPKCSS
ncbi:MAG: hypothetical protein EP348_12025 [Alphaproteobacteria bacterium]|nr:MAG: hypothetical protein EP348_12025 [Alphaproteobacteria bacterium]